MWSTPLQLRPHLTVLTYRNSDGHQQFLIKFFVEFCCGLVALFALKYMFDIEHPKACNNPLLFLERCIIKITTGISLSKATMSDIQKSI